MAVLPAVRMAGRLQLHRSEPPPDHLAAQVWLRRPGRATHETRPEVHLEGADFAFFAPRGTLDLRLAVPDRVPMYRWGVPATASRHDLGSIALRRGGSIAGFVVDSERGQPAVDVSVMVSALFVSHGEPAERERSGLRTIETITDERGFFQAADLEPGRYSVRATGDRDLVADLAGVEVRESSETLLPQPLDLRSPARLRLVVTPDQHPTEGRWIVRLWPLADGDLRQADANIDGLAELRGVARGDYRLMLLTERGTLGHLEERWVGGDETIQIDLPLMPIEGQLHQGDVPLIGADLRLSTGSGSRWSYRTDEDGRFEGVIDRPEHGFLFADVVANPGAAGSWIGDLLIEEGEDFTVEEETIALDLDLQGRRIRGMVVDARDQPVAGARVVARQTRFGVEGFTDERGHFELPGLDDKLYEITARHPRKGSAPLEEVDLRRTREAEALRLRLRPFDTVAGRLLSPAGAPLGGAVIRLTSGQPAPGWAERTTAADGRFEAPLPVGTESTVVTVLAPQAVLWSGCVRLDREGEGPPALEVRLPAMQGGWLEIDTRFQPELPPAASGQLVLLTEAGGFLTPQIRNRWHGLISAVSTAEDRGEGRRIRSWPGLAPGSYATLWTHESASRLAVRSCERTTTAAGRWEYLAAGGSVRLEFDYREEQRRQLENRTGFDGR